MTAHSQAVALAGDLPGLLLDAKLLAAAAPGLHGRRRAGAGEAFWQYRDHRAEDGPRLIDWRRSGRGERLYVRDREWEAAQTAWFWIDPDPGFAWRANEDRQTKKQRAQTLALALAILLTRGGERVGALGGATRAGARAPERLAFDLAANAQEPAPPSTRACVIYLSDFYAPVEQWRARLARASQAGADGVLVMIADPAEEDFPFRGRTLFQEPGAAGREALIGSAENAAALYRERLAAHRAALREMAAAHGFPALLHRTDHSAAPTLAFLCALLADRFG
ncbi:MAG: DUF58 domain-containing protein [Hyphomonadaceae bacterium]